MVLKRNKNENCNLPQITIFFSQHYTTKKHYLCRIVESKMEIMNATSNITIDQIRFIKYIFSEFLNKYQCNFYILKLCQPLTIYTEKTLNYKQDRIIS